MTPNVPNFKPNFVPLPIGADLRPYGRVIELPEYDKGRFASSLYIMTHGGQDIAVHDVTPAEQ